MADDARGSRLSAVDDSRGSAALARRGNARVTCELSHRRVDIRKMLRGRQAMEVGARAGNRRAELSKELQGKGLVGHAQSNGTVIGNRAKRSGLA